MLNTTPTFPFRSVTESAPLLPRDWNPRAAADSVLQGLVSVMAVPKKQRCWISLSLYPNLCLNLRYERDDDKE